MANQIERFLLDQSNVLFRNRYNPFSTETLVFQMACGPLFGDMLDDVLKDARKYSDSIKYVR